MITSLKMALRSIKSNKMRAALTMLGIVIGVLSLVVLVSLVKGATSSITSQVSGLGSSLISVSIADDHGESVSIETMEAWRGENSEIGEIAAYASASLTGKYDTDSTTLTVYGITPAYFEINGLGLNMGRDLKRADLQNNSTVCVLSEETATELVGFSDCVGETISLGGMKYTVVGILEESSGGMKNPFEGKSYAAYIPYTSLVRLSDSVTMDVTSFCVSAAEDSSVDAVTNTLNHILLNRFEEDDDAFSVSSQDGFESVMNNITTILAILLGGIAGISLLVGGIGIMNIMLVTVTERTREIGIRKAIGATTQSILKQFLMEAVVLCMMGCAIGIFVSWAILQLVGMIAVSLDMTFKLNASVVIIAVVFCFAIGIIFGLYPARKAAKMKPIDALHYGG